MHVKGQNFVYPLSLGNIIEMGCLDSKIRVEELGQPHIHVVEAPDAPAFRHLAPANNALAQNGKEDYRRPT